MTASKQSGQQDDRATLESLINRYFEGLHFANIELLASIFHPDCVLKAPNLRRNQANWLALVETRDSPATLGHGFNYRLLCLDIAGRQALAKVYCPLLGHEFIDYLGFLYEDGRWLIVNKMYADHAFQQPIA